MHVAAFDAYCGYSGGYISPHDTLAGTYARLTALTTRPIWVSELGCREPSRNDGVPADPTWTKAQWYGQVFALTEFPRIKHVNFFSALRERDWRVNSTAAATAVVKANLAKAHSGAPMPKIPNDMSAAAIKKRHLFGYTEKAAT